MSKDMKFAVVCITTGGEYLYTKDDDVYDDQPAAKAALKAFKKELREDGMDADDFAVVACYQNADGTHTAVGGPVLTEYAD